MVVIAVIFFGGLALGLYIYTLVPPLRHMRGGMGESGDTATIYMGVGSGRALALPIIS